MQTDQAATSDTVSLQDGVQWLAVWSLARRELLRFVRQRNRVFGALAQPVIFWLIFGAGLNGSFAPGGRGDESYIEYFFPGTVVLVLLFTAIFATISIIEDRNEGFMQGMLVAPLTPTSLVLGKVFGTTILAVGQALLVFPLAPLLGVDISVIGVLLSLPLLVLIAFGLAGLGTTIAWRMTSTQGFHAIMTAFLMPMWFLSGAFFPTDGAPWWLSLTIALNPLTYGVAALRHAMLVGHAPPGFALPSAGISLLVTVAFSLSMLALARATVASPNSSAGA